MINIPNDPATRTRQDNNVNTTHDHVHFILRLTIRACTHNNQQQKQTIYLIRQVKYEVCAWQEISTSTEISPSTPPTTGTNPHSETWDPQLIPNSAHNLTKQQPTFTEPHSKSITTKILNHKKEQPNERFAFRERHTKKYANKSLQYRTPDKWQLTI